MGLYLELFCEAMFLQFLTNLLMEQLNQQILIEHLLCLDHVIKIKPGINMVFKHMALGFYLEILATTVPG